VGTRGRVAHNRIRAGELLDQHALAHAAFAEQQHVLAALTWRLIESLLEVTKNTFGRGVGNPALGLDAR
jgi:hypothetical protein